MEKLWHSLEQFLQSILTALPKFVVGLVVIVVGLYIVNFIIKVLSKRFQRREVDKSLSGFLLSMIRVGLYVLLYIIASGIMGFTSLSFTAVMASAGLAVGLALQGSLSNFAGGVLILVFKPFKVGDYISNPSNTEGTVERIDLLYTTLSTATGLKVFSPNGQLANSVITNYTEITKRRYDFVVGISYDANIKVAQEIILAVLSTHAEVLNDPAPSVFVTNLADSSVNLNVRMWMARDNYWNTVYAIQQEVKVALDKGNIEIPFPQTDLHIISDQTK